MLNLGPLKVGNRTEILQTSTKGQFLIFFPDDIQIRTDIQIRKRVFLSIYLEKHT